MRNTRLEVDQLLLGINPDNIMHMCRHVDSDTTPDRRACTVRAASTRIHRQDVALLRQLRTKPQNLAHITRIRHTCDQLRPACQHAPVPLHIRQSTVMRHYFTRQMFIQIRRNLIHSPPFFC